MLRQLKIRPRSDNHVNQKRSAGSNWGRRVYLLLLVIFAVSLSNFLWGDFIAMRCDGLVVRNKNVVALTYVARVGTVAVSEGHTVRKGDFILGTESMEVLERLADLSIRQAALTQRAAEFHFRSKVAAQLLPLAIKRESETAKILGRFDDLNGQGLLTTQRYDEALRANFDASKDRIKLAAEQDSLRKQIHALETARTDAAKAIKNLQAHYADGQIRAETDGSIGSKIPSVGDVYRAGEPMLSIFSGEAYVLTYLPTRYLFSIRPGMKVIVTSGRHEDEGEIIEILPFSDTLPSEFQNTYKPSDRNQLAKIKLSDPTNFPVFAKVRITRKYF